MKQLFALRLHPFTKITTGAAFVLTALSCITVQADVLYRETFGTATTGTQGAPSGYDWAAFVGTTAFDSSANIGTTNASINRTAGASKPGNTDAIGNVNAGAVIGATPAAYGAGIAFATQASGNAFFWTPEYATTSGTGSGINPSLYTSLAFSWFEGNGAIDSSWRVAVQVGGLWYVSQQQFLNTAAVTAAGNFALGGNDGNGGANHGAELKSFTYTTAASSWFQLSFDGAYSMATHTGTSGTVLTLGAQPGSNLSGNIDAFGLFSDVPGAAPGANRRFDTFEIDVTPVPEPASIALLGMGGLVALLWKRRKA